MALLAEEDVRDALGRLLRTPPNQIWWEHAVEIGLIQDVINYDYDGEEDKNEELLALLDRYREDEDYASRMRAADKNKLSRVPLRRVSEPTPALDALSDIMALEAAAHPLVVAFRERVLGGVCVAAGDVTAWHLAHDGKLDLKSFGRLGDWPPLHVRANAWEAQVDAERYAAGKLPVPENGAGDFLYCVAEVLLEAYGWPHLKAVADFILSGGTPRLPGAIAYMRPRERFFPKSTSIHLVVNPQMEPLKLMSLYASMRHTYMEPGARIRPPDGAMSRLAVFAARHNDGRTWQAALSAWTAEGGWRDDESQRHQQYDDERSFTRDARKAYRMVTGQDLEWKGLPAKPEEKL